MSRGQSLVELTVCAPVVTLLALGAVALVELEVAKEGLNAATHAAAGAAARAPDVESARWVAQQRFVDVAGAYPLSAPVLRLGLTTFQRGAVLTAESTASVDVGWGGFLGIPDRVLLQSTAEAVVDPWRSRGSP